MKKALFAGCLAVMMLLSMSVALLRLAVSSELIPQASAEESSVQAVESEPVQNTVQDTVPYDENHQVRVLCGDTVQEMTLAEYLTGVVLGEMPASFPQAALEAQAVAARTFVLRQEQAPKHDNADVCSDSSCCQKYCLPEQAVAKLGEQYETYIEKVRSAVSNTDGLVITYHQELIDAVYFSCSGGETEAAVAVWGSDVPYLQSVDSPGEENSRVYSDSIAIPTETFREKILSQAPQADLSSASSGWFGDLELTDGGGVQTLAIGGVSFSGTELRSLFGLRSTRFTVAIEGDNVVFDTLGYGHRVGMSQYGAQAMAESGADFREILTHYYTGVEIVPAENL